MATRDRKRPSTAKKTDPPPTLTPTVEPIGVGDAKPVKSGTSEVQKSETPKYLTLEHKDVRVRADQLADLDALRRRVLKSRTEKTERITDNTLIRVAIDLLLAQGDALVGNTEEELRASISTGDDAPSSARKR